MALEYCYDNNQLSCPTDKQIVRFANVELGGASVEWAFQCTGCSANGF